MTEEIDVESENRLAAALLAHSNYELAKKVVERVLEAASKEAMRRISDQILDLLPKAAADRVWTAVCRYAERKGLECVDSAEFKQRADRFLAAKSDEWIQERLEAGLRDLVGGHVNAMLKRYDMSQVIRELPVRFKAELERQTAAIALEEAKAASRTGKKKGG